MMIVTLESWLSDPKPTSRLILAADSRSVTTVFGLVTAPRSLWMIICRTWGSSRACAHSVRTW